MGARPGPLLPAARRRPRRPRPRSRRVLDVGAGDGWFAHELRAELPPAATVVCWDINYRSEDLARRPGRHRAHRGAPGRAVRRRARAGRARARRRRRGVPRRRARPGASPPTARRSSACRPTRGCSRDHDRMLEHHRRYRPARASGRWSTGTSTSWPPARCSRTLRAAAGGERRSPSELGRTATRPASARGSGGPAADQRGRRPCSTPTPRVGRWLGRLPASPLPGLSTCGPSPGAGRRTPSLSGESVDASSCRASTRPAASTPPRWPSWPSSRRRARARRRRLDRRHAGRAGRGSSPPTRDALRRSSRSPTNVGKGEAVRPGCWPRSPAGAESSATTTPTWPRRRPRWPGSSTMLRERPDLDVVLGSRVGLLGHAHRALDGPPLPRAGCSPPPAASCSACEVYDTQCGAKVFRDGPALRAALAPAVHEPLGVRRRAARPPAPGDGRRRRAAGAAFLEVPLHDVARRRRQQARRRRRAGGGRPGPRRPSPPARAARPRQRPPRPARRRSAARTARRCAGRLPLGQLGVALGTLGRSRGRARRSRRRSAPAEPPGASSAAGVAARRERHVGRRSMRPAGDGVRPGLVRAPARRRRGERRRRRPRSASSSARSASSSPSTKATAGAPAGGCSAAGTLEEHEAGVSLPSARRPSPTWRTMPSSVTNVTPLRPRAASTGPL